MKLLEIFKKKKLLLLNIFLTLYIITNFIGGERGLVSYLEKKNVEKKLITYEKKLIEKIEILDNKNKLLSKQIDLDYLDILYREKLKFGKKDEILIKLR
jgi:cell division protein DivIC